MKKHERDNAIALVRSWVRAAPLTFRLPVVEEDKRIGIGCPKKPSGARWQAVVEGVRLIMGEAGYEEGTLWVSFQEKKEQRPKAEESLGDSHRSK